MPLILKSYVCAMNKKEQHVFPPLAIWTGHLKVVNL